MGRFFSDNMKRRKVVLENLLKAITEAEGYVIAGLPVTEIYKRLSGEGEVGKMFKNMAERGNEDTVKLWKAEVDDLSVNSEDKAALTEFAAGFGKSVLSDQKNNFKICLTKLSKQLDEAEEKYGKEGAVCRKLGLCAGVLLCIFLF